MPRLKLFAMKIAIAQLNYTIGDVDGNASKIIDSIHKAKAQRADLVIFAEQAVSGTPAFDLLRKTTFPRTLRGRIWSRSPRAATASPPSSAADPHERTARSAPRR